MRGNKEKGERQNGIFKALMMSVVKYIAACSIYVYLKASFKTRHEDIVVRPKSGDLSTNASLKIIADAIKRATHDKLPFDPDLELQFQKVLEDAGMAYP